MCPPGSHTHTHIIPTLHCSPQNTHTRSFSHTCLHGKEASVHRRLQHDCPPTRVSITPTHTHTHIYIHSQTLNSNFTMLATDIYPPINQIPQLLFSKLSCNWLAMLLVLCTLAL